MSAEAGDGGPTLPANFSTNLTNEQRVSKSAIVQNAVTSRRAFVAIIYAAGVPTDRVAEGGNRWCLVQFCATVYPA